MLSDLTFLTNEKGQILKERFEVLPGITSSWVVNGSHNLTFKEWMELDLEYVRNKNIITDFDIAIKTVKIIVKGLILET